MTRHPVTLFLCCAALAAIGLSCSKAPGPVVLVTVAGLRTDGAEPASFAARLKARTDARRTPLYTASPDTVLALAALHTGRDPAALGLLYGDTARLPADAPTLAEGLAARGTTCAAFVGDGAVTPSSGLARGFATWDGPPAGLTVAGTAGEVGQALGGARPAAAVVDAAVRFLAARGDDKAPLFLWLHFGDPESYAAAGPDPRAGAQAAYEAVGSALDTLVDRLGPGARVAVVGTSGLALGEEGETLHGLTLAPGVVRVPLVAAGLGEADPQSLTGLYALLARAGGLEAAPSGDAPGVVAVTTSLPSRQYGWPAAGLAASAAGVLTVDGRVRWTPAGGAAVLGPAAWDAAPAALRERLGQAGVVPGEVPARADVLAAMADAVRAIRARDGATLLARLQVVLEQAPNAAAPRTMLVNALALADPATQTALAARRQSALDELVRLAGDDPARRFDAAETLAAVGQGSRALELLRPLAAARLSGGERLRLARAFLAAGSTAEASTLVEALATAEPTAADLQETLGDVLVREGNGFRARQAYERAVSLPGGNTARTRAKLGDALAALGEKDAALAAYAQSAALDPAYRYPHARAGELLLQKNEPGAAADAFAKSLVPTGDPVRDAQERAVLLASRGLARAAAIELDRALKDHPGDERLETQLARVLLDAGGLASARARIEPFLAAHPGHPAMSVELARLEMLEGRAERAVAALEQAEERAGPDLTARVRQDPVFQRAGSSSPVAQRAAAFTGRGQRPASAAR